MRMMWKSREKRRIIAGNNAQTGKRENGSLLMP